MTTLNEYQVFVEGSAIGTVPAFSIKEAFQAAREEVSEMYDPGTRFSVEAMDGPERKEGRV